MISKSEKIKKLKIIREKKIRDARKSFWSYCMAVDPAFYKESRSFLKDYCNLLQDVYEEKILNEHGDPYKGVLISFPPRHGKSRTLVLFTTWMLGKESKKSIMTFSYNQIPATKFSVDARDTIIEEPSFNKISFQDVFPEVKMKRGNASKNMWALEGSPFSYLGSGLNGSATSLGASLAMIIDDPVKNAAVAFNEVELDKIYETYANTLMSRPQEGALTIIVQTRWSKRDLIGRILDSPNAKDFLVVEYKAYNEKTGKMLCDEILSYKRYTSLRNEMLDMIFMANYQQQLVDKKGALYPGLENNKYSEIPKHLDGTPAFTNIVAYTDVATSGSDYFATVIAGIYENRFYVLDMIYTQKNVDVTETLLVDKLIEHDVITCVIESNNAGEMFGRNIKTMLKERESLTVIKMRNQSKNKETRLLLNSPIILNSVFFPSDVNTTHSEAWSHLLQFSKEGKNRHDDIEDALTGLVEEFKSIKKKKSTFFVL